MKFGITINLYTDLTHMEPVCEQMDQQLCISICSVHKKCTGFKQTFDGSNLRMLNVTFEIFILHYTMEYVDNLCSPCPLHEQPKR